MFEKDASLALSDTRFLTEGQYIAYSSVPVMRLCVLLGSAVAEVQQKDVEVDESLFQDLEDLELEEQG